MIGYGPVELGRMVGLTRREIGVALNLCFALFNLQGLTRTEKRIELFSP